MEPVKQLIQMASPTHFKPSYQAGDSQESFLAYLGQTRVHRRSSGSGDSGQSQVDLSPLARMVGSLSTEGQHSLVSLMEIVPEGQREQLGMLLGNLIGETDPSEIESDLSNVLELFNRLANNNEEEGLLNIELSLRELSGLPDKSQKFFFETLDDFLNLSSRDLTGLITNRDGLSDEEFDEFLTVLSNLLKRGVIGTEEVRVRDQKQKTFVTTRIGDSRLREAEPYRRGRYPLDPTERKHEIEK